MPSCSVKWCSNHTSTCSLKLKNGVSFHRFPKDEETCQKWVEAVRHERRDPWWTSSNASRICSIHFKETDISSTLCKVNILAKTAVPICTMVWYDEDENSNSTKISNEVTKPDKPILKTYERKKTNINVLKELKLNMSYNWNKEGTGMSKTDSVVMSNTTLSLYQNNLPQASKLLKTLEVPKPLNSKEFQESNSIANINSKTSATANVTEPQKNTVLIESNKKDYAKYCQEKCCKSKILVKVNDNTSLIIDEDWSNDDTIFRDSNKINKEPNSRKCDYFRNVTTKEFKSNGNKEPNKVTNISNSDMFLKTITNGNVELNTNISKSYVGKMLRTYLPNRKDKISERNIRDTSEHLKKNKSLRSITTEKGLNTVKYKKVYNSNINKHSKGDFRNKLKINVFYKNNIIASNTNRKKNQRTLLNVKKYTIKRRSNLFNRPRIRKQKIVAVETNIDVNKESNIAHIGEFITNQSKIDNIKETAVYDEIISGLFETPKNVGNISSNDNYQVSNENVCTYHNIDSALDKGTNNRNVILDLDTNIYTELITLTDLELCRLVNTGLHGENREEEEKTEVNTNKTTTNENITQFIENTMSESDQQMPFVNKTINSNENIHNNTIFLPNNELLNLESTIVRNIVPETKTEKFTELKKCLSMKPKLDSPSELCANVLTQIDKNIFSRYDHISSTPLTKENLQVSNRGHNTVFNKNKGIDVNDMIKSLQSNIVYVATKETDSNVIRSKQLNSNFFEEFLNNISPDSNNSQNVVFITNLKTDPYTTREPESNEKKISDINVESKKIIGKDMPDLDTIMNLDIGLNSSINSEFNTNKTDNADFLHYNENTAKESNQKLSMINKNVTAEQSDHLIPISIQCNKSLEKDMPESNPVILSELNVDQVIKSKEVMNRKLNHLNTEMYTNKELDLKKSRKDFVNVLETSDDQHKVVNEHMDVVASILNRDIAAEFDLSLLLSDTSIPDEEIPNLDNNSDNNSLDGIVGSPNWIQLPTGEIPKIIDDILEQGSSFFENLDLHDKYNKFNIVKESNRKYHEIKNLTKEKYPTSNLEQLKEQIINNDCDNGKQWTNNSIAQIEKQLIAEISGFSETSLKQSNNICKENKVSQSKKVTAEKCCNLCDEQTDKQILEQCLQSNNEQCDQFNLDQIVEKRYENRDTGIQIGNNTIHQCQLENNADLKANQIGDPSINQYFKQSVKLQQNGNDNSNDEASTEVDIFEKSKKQSDKQSNEQTYRLSVGKQVTMEESTSKSTIYTQGTLESNVPVINRQLFKDCNKERMEVNIVSNEAHTADTESVRELNIGQLKKDIFEECYDPECGNNCKNQNHNLNSESNKKNDELYEKQTFNTSCQSNIDKRRRERCYDLLHIQQCYQTGSDILKKQLKNSYFDSLTKEMKNKSFLESHKLSHNEKYKTKYKKIAIDHIPGQYLELRWKEGKEKSNTLSQEGCKRKYEEIGLDHRKMLCSGSTNNFSQQIMAECPECGYTTDDNDLMNYKSDVDLTITKPLSLINKDTLISSDIENENNNQNTGNNNRVALESVYAMELAYITAIQALERKLKQKIAISEHRLRKVNNLSKINNQLSFANSTLMDLFRRNKV